MVSDNPKQKYMITVSLLILRQRNSTNQCFLLVIDNDHKLKT